MTVKAPPELPSQPRTIKQGGGRAWIHAAPTHGRYTNLRLVTSALLLVALFAAPWVKIGGFPFLKLSFLEPSFFIFGRPIMIYEFYHFGLLAILLVFTLFLASALYGRIWCGYACPQTVFIEQLFGRIENFFEGPAARITLAAGKPLTFRRLLAKVGKQTTFFAVSAAFAFSLVALFTGPELLLAGTSRSAWIALGLLTGLAWFDGAYWREQFCHIVCPYGRFQALMQDQATRTIGYDVARGEPRKKGKDRSGAGDCIDCGLCVRVCPSGIDIRHGAHQMECIGCAKCVDACNIIMKQTGQDPGLIRYDAVAMFVPSPPKVRPRILRPRLIAYGLLWLLLTTVGVVQFVRRTPFHVRILSVAGATPYFVDNGRVKNILSVKIGNQWTSNDTYVLTAKFVGSDAESESSDDLKIESPATFGPLAPGTEAVYPVLLSVPRKLSGKLVTLTIKGAGTEEAKSFERQILGPAE